MISVSVREFIRARFGFAHQGDGSVLRRAVAPVVRPPECDSAGTTAHAPPLTHLPPSGLLVTVADDGNDRRLCKRERRCRQDHDLLPRSDCSEPIPRQDGVGGGRRLLAWWNHRKIRRDTD